MARATIVTFDYHEFRKLLRRATDTGKRIERSDAIRWRQYIERHGIREVQATSHATQRYEDAVGVILDEGLPTDGLYFYSERDEACLRLVPIE